MHPQSAEKFINFVLSPAGQELYRKFGFTALGP
jgi:ABC-type Fe3+ transport system substrate-binding protein